MTNAIDDYSYTAVLLDRRRVRYRVERCMLKNDRASALIYNADVEHAKATVQLLTS